MSEPADTRPHRPARPRHGRRAPSPSCSPSAPTRSSAATGRRPEISGVLTPQPRATSTRSSRGSDLIVELMGGIDPARELRARGAARPASPVVTANKQLLAQHGDELFAAAREAGVAAALRGRGRRRRPGRSACSRSARGRARSIAGLRDRQRDDQLHPHARWPRPAPSYDEVLARAQELGYAEADPTDDVSGADAAAKMAILARLAFDTPVDLDDVTYEGIEHDPARRPRLRQGARPRR